MVKKGLVNRWYSIRLDAAIGKVFAISNLLKVLKKILQSTTYCIYMAHSPSQVSIFWMKNTKIEAFWNSLKVLFIKFGDPTLCWNSHRHKLCSFLIYQKPFRFPPLNHTHFCFLCQGIFDGI
jgi:hypothetical protein